MLADSIKQASSQPYSYQFSRMQTAQKRKPQEIGFSSIRGGNIVGEHQVLFFGEHETLEIKHTAYARSIFAEGAIKAALFLVKQKPGLYTLNDLP